jgi:hypothetical protein
MPQLDRPDPRSAFYAWKATNPAKAEDIKEVWSAAYLMGARDAIKSSAKLAELAPMLGQLIMWLESDPEWVTGEAVPDDEPEGLTDRLTDGTKAR